MSNVSGASSWKNLPLTRGYVNTEFSLQLCYVIEVAHLSLQSLKKYKLKRPFESPAVPSSSPFPTPEIRSDGTDDACNVGSRTLFDAGSVPSTPSAASDSPILRTLPELTTNNPVLDPSSGSQKSIPVFRPSKIFSFSRTATPTSAASTDGERHSTPRGANTPSRLDSDDTRSIMSDQPSEISILFNGRQNNISLLEIDEPVLENSEDPMDVEVTSVSRPYVTVEMTDLFGDVVAHEEEGSTTKTPPIDPLHKQKIIQCESGRPPICTCINADPAVG